MTQRYYWVEIKHFPGLPRHKAIVFNNMAAVARCYDTMLPIDTPSLLRRRICYGRFYLNVLCTHKTPCIHKITLLPKVIIFSMKICAAMISSSYPSNMESYKTFITNLTIFFSCRGQLFDFVFNTNKL